MALLTKYVDHAAADTTGDGSVGDPWKYCWQAMAAIKTDAGTNHYKIYVKASETYGTDGTDPNPSESDDADHDGAGGSTGALIYLDQASPGATTPNVWEGYHTSVGDGGVVSVDCVYDGANALTDGVWCASATSFHTVFKNFDFQNASGAGINGSIVADHLTLKNIRCKGCGTGGILADDYILLENCVADGNTGHGIAIENYCVIVSCIAKNNSVIGIKGKWTTMYNCLAYDNGNTVQIEIDGSGGIYSCTVDANNGAASTGIHQDGATTPLIAVNNIVYDCNVGILADADLGELVISRNNLFNSNNDDCSAFQAEYDGGDGAPETGNGVGDLGHVTGVPGFTGTYLPGANAQNAALDHHYTNNFWTSFDAADNPPEPENE